MKYCIKGLVVLATVGMLWTIPVYGNSYQYDALNRVTQVTNEDGSIVTYTYDPNGNITDVHVTQFPDQNWDDENGEDDDGDKPGDDGGNDDGTDKPDDGTDDDGTDKPDDDAGKEDDTGKDDENPGSSKPNDSGTTNPSAGEMKKVEKIQVKTSNAIYTIVKNSDKGDYAIFKAFQSGKKTSYTVPKTVKYQNVSYPVTEIAEKAFYKKIKLKKIVIGKNIEKIGKSAFNGAKNLKRITVKTTKLTSVGKNALKGIHKNAVVKVPKKKLKKYQKLFKNKGQKKTVKIKK